MKGSPFLSPTWVGAYLVVIFLGVLYYSESLVRQNTFLFQSGGRSDAKPLIFPLDEPLSVLSTGTGDWAKLKRKESLRGLLEKAGRFDGKLLVNFWATWCEPCIEEIPALGTLADQLKNQPNQSLPLLITISVDESPQPVLLFEKKLGRPYPFLVLHDPDGAFSRKLGIMKFPETFLIDAQGNTLQKWIGPQDWLSQEILQLIEKSCT